MKTVVVTGAAGGVGSTIANRLSASGFTVIGIDRRAPRETPDFAFLVTDLFAKTVEEAFEAADVVVHTAAMLDLSLDYEALEPDNVTLVDRVVTLCKTYSVSQLIHLSDGCIYESGRGLRTEDDPSASRNAYEKTKFEAESIVRASDVRWTILRPALVYGPGTESMSANLVTLPPILRNFFRYLPGLSGGNRANWAHVDDVASAVETVLNNEDALGETFNVADDTPLGFGEALTAIAEAYGFSLGPMFPFPSPTILTMFVPVVDRDYVERTLRTALNALWSRIVERHELTTPLRPKVDRSVVFFVSEDNVLDNSSLKTLGWEPTWRSFVDGIPETIRWYQAHGWVPTYQAPTDGQRVGYGFKFEHRFEGTFTRNGTRSPMTVVVETELPNVSRADLAGDANGDVTIEGWIDDLASEGTADFAFVSRRTLAYQFGFNAGDSSHRLFISTKLNPLRPISSLREWTGTIVGETGDELGDVELEIDFASQAVAMLMSFSLLS